MLNSDLDMEGSGKLRIFLIGGTGAGKSSTGNTVLGEPPPLFPKICLPPKYWRAEEERRMEKQRAEKERLAEERSAEVKRRMEEQRAELELECALEEQRAEEERRMESSRIIRELSAEEGRRAKKERLKGQRAERERVLKISSLFAELSAEEGRRAKKERLLKELRAAIQRLMKEQRAEEERLAKSYSRKTGDVYVLKNPDKTRETLKQTGNRSSIRGNAPGVAELLPEGRIVSSVWKCGADGLHVKNNEPERQQTSTKALQSSRKSGGQDHSKDDNQKQKLAIVLSGSTSKSSLGHKNGRVDIYVGDRNLQTESVRQEQGIRDVISIHEITVPSDAANDPDSKLVVRMRPYGEGKDSWEHCTTQDGDVGLPEVQPLYIFHVMRGCSAFPASATWILETPDKCTPSSLLEAELEIKLVMSGSMKPAKDRQDSSGSPVARLSLQVQGREYPKVVTRSQTPLLCNGSDTEQSRDTLEEKYQSEAMEK